MFEESPLPHSALARRQNSPGSPPERFRQRDPPSLLQRGIEFLAELFGGTPAPHEDRYSWEEVRRRFEQERELYQRQAEAIEARLRAERAAWEGVWLREYQTAPHARRLQMLRDRIAEERLLWELAYLLTQSRSAVPPAPPVAPPPSPTLESIDEEDEIEVNAMEVAAYMSAIPWEERATEWGRIEDIVHREFPPYDAAAILRHARGLLDFPPY